MVLLFALLGVMVWAALAGIAVFYMGADFYLNRWDFLHIALFGIMGAIIGYGVEVLIA